MDASIESGGGEGARASIDLTRDEKQKGMHYGFYAAATGTVFFFAVGGNVLTLFVKRLGASNTQLGGILSFLFVFSIVQVFVAPLIERHGKKPFIIRGWLVATTLAFSYVTVPWIYNRWGTEAAIYSLMAFIVPLAMARQIAVAGWMPLLNDVVPTHMRGRYFGKMRAIWQGSGIVFLTLTSLFFGGKGDAPLWQYQVVFLVGITASYLRIAAISRMPELPPAVEEAKPSFFRTFSLPLGDREYVKFLLFSTLLAAALALTDSYMVVYLKSAALAYGDSKALFVSAVVFWVGSALSVIVWGWLADRLGAKPLLVINVLAMGAVRFLWFAALLPMAGGYVIVLIYFLNGVFSAGFGIASTKYLFAISPRSFGKTTYLTTAGVLATVVTAGMVPLGGYIIDGLSSFHAGLSRFGLDEYRLPFVASGALVFLAAMLLSGIREHKTVATREVLAALFGRPLRTGYNVFLWGRSLPEERRVSVTRTLGDIGSVIGEEELLKALEDPSFQVRREAAEALVRMKSARTVRPLVEKLNDPHSFIRANAAVALGEIGSPAACEALEAALRDGNPELRLQAALALGKIGRGDSAVAIREALSAEEDPVVWSVMATALGMLGDDAIAREVVGRLCPDTPGSLRGQLLIAASNAIGAGNDLYKYLHRGEDGFEESAREITAKIIAAIRSLPHRRELEDLWGFLEVEKSLRAGDFQYTAAGALQFALLLYGKDAYPRESACGAALEALSARRESLMWDSALLSLVSLEIMVRKYPRWSAVEPPL